MIIPLPPVSLTFCTASISLNSSSSTVTHCLHFQHRNAVAAPPLTQPKTSLPRPVTIFYAVLWPL